MNHSRRRASRAFHASDYHSLESKSLLAGVVHVDMVGNNLHIRGDGLANTFAVDLSAKTTEAFVQGHEQTTVRFSNDFRNGVDLSRLRDILIMTSHGDDNVTLAGAGVTLADDLTVLMGYGDDSLYIVGDSDLPFQINDDVRIFGHAGHDSLSMSNVRIDDDLTVFAGAGKDAMALNHVSVADHTKLWGQYGHDTFLVNDSSFGDDVRVEFGAGADLFESTSSAYLDRIVFRGSQGWDWVTLDDSNQVNDRVKWTSIERQSDVLNQRGRAGDAIAQVKSAFFESGREMELKTANLVHDGLIELAMAYSVDLVSLDLNATTQAVSVADPTPTVSVIWDQAAQQAVAAIGVGPTIGSRAYAMMHTAMYDAWSAYDETAISTQLGDDLQRPASENTVANKNQAMSFAAYRVLDDLFSNQSTIFNDVMSEFGFDPTNTSTDVSTAAGIGNRMAQALLTFRHQDGANQLGDDVNGTNGVAYSDTTNFQPVNEVGNPSVMDAWTPEFVPIDSQPGDGSPIQQFLTPHWGEVVPFGLASSTEFLPPAPESFLMVDGVVDLHAKMITLADGTVLSIDKSLIGSVINPAFITQAEEVVRASANLNEEQKLIAEFWEDGGGTSFPPGTFMTFGEFVSARDNHSVDQDARMFFALGNAVFDAGVATWEAKTHYDYVRPVRAIRELGELGLIGEFDAALGGNAIEAWTPSGATQTILATSFLTYQTPGSDPSPPFSEYTSGHSAFSAAGATILRMFTGSDRFGASVTFEPGQSRFEPGMTPSSQLTLSWSTFTAAADEAGVSRIYGGIHFNDGDINGRTLGAEVGQSAWEQSLFFINGG